MRGPLCLPVVVCHRISSGHEAESEGCGERKRRKKEHLERCHAEAARFDEVDYGGILHARVRHQHPEIPIVTDKLQKAMITPFIAGGAWL